MFYNDTFVDVLFRDWNGDRKSSRCLPNTSTFVPNDRPQSVYCVLPIMQCAFGAHIDVGLSRSDQPRADSLEISRFLRSFLGKMTVFDKTESLKRLLQIHILEGLSRKLYQIHQQRAPDLCGPTFQLITGYIPILDSRSQTSALK